MYVDIYVYAYKQRILECCWNNRYRNRHILWKIEFKTIWKSISGFAGGWKYDYKHNRDFRIWPVFVTRKDSWIWSANIVDDITNGKQHSEILCGTSQIRWDAKKQISTNNCTTFVHVHSETVSFLLYLMLFYAWFKISYRIYFIVTGV